ncbi:hypothetical protein OG21DRAFT_1513068 [Imleria badia]|nr:hypothetical protein OG21DRAFT_1513068 [Imleria badia]
MGLLENWFVSCVPCLLRYSRILILLQASILSSSPCNAPAAPARTTPSLMATTNCIPDLVSPHPQGHQIRLLTRPPMTLLQTLFLPRNCHIYSWPPGVYCLSRVSFSML